MATYMKLKTHFQKMSKNCSFWDFSQFSKNLQFSLFELLSHKEGPLGNSNQHSNTLGVLLLENNICCFCCWKILILSIYLILLFILLFWYFSDIDKINIFQQQKQQVLFLSNKTHKVLMCWLVLLRGPSLWLRSSKSENWRFFENSEKSQNEQFFDIFWKWVFSFIYVAIGRT